MRKVAIVVLALVLGALAFSVPAVTHAAAGALCWADSYELAQGDSTGVYCTGFSPLTMINVYLVEPDGTAAYYADVKSDAAGNVAFGWGNGVKNQFSYLLGTYTFVVQELGLGNQVLTFGKIEIRNIGDGDHVSGAYLETDAKSYDRASQSVTLRGWGFAPGEIVSAWEQQPALCSSYTAHYVDGKNGATFENIDEVRAEGTYGIFDIKADSSGAFVISGIYFAQDCEGTWRIAARGNTSGLGAYTEFVITGPAVATNAWLVPSKSSVGAFNDTIQFWASGFGANEILNCWTTSPDGRAIPFGIPGSLDQIKVGADGSGVISLTTGSHIISPDDPFFNGVTVQPLLSEGSLGVWKMSCNGLASGTTAIAEYTVYGYETSP